MEVGPGERKKLVDHVQTKVEDQFWEQNGLQKRYLDEFIISVTESDSSEDESSEKSVHTREFYMM